MKSFIAAALFCATLPAFAVSTPDVRECLAPSDPGGGWDFTCRSISKLLYDEKIVPNNIQTVNMAGASGGVAFAHVVSKRDSDNSLFVAASTATTTRLAQNQYPGMNEKMVRWIGAIGADYGVIAVRKDSKYQNITEIMDAIKKDPSSVKFAGASSAGGWDHLKMLIAAEKAGIKDVKTIPYLSFNNGGDALTQVIGGHLNAFTGDISETKGFLHSGDLRILAVFSDKRLPAPFNDIPTAKEQGIDFVAPNWRGFYLPGKVSDATYDWWATTLQNLSKDPQWQKVMTENGLVAFKKTGKDFDDYVNQQITNIRNISKTLGIIQ